MTMTLDQQKFLNGLFLAIFIIVGIGPKFYLTYAGLLASEDGYKHVIYNFLYICLFLTSIYVLFVFKSPILPFLANPIIYLYFLWMVFCAFIVGDTMTILKKMVFMFFMLTIFSVAPLLPEDENKTAELLSIFCLVILFLCYLGVVAFPNASIHQASDPSERHLAGSWRGIYSHKSSAGFNVSIIALTGFYVFASGLKQRGAMIVILSLVFLIFSSSKTGLALIIPCLIVGYMVKIQKINLINLFIIIGLPVTIHGITMTSLFHLPFRDYLMSLGIDATFTGRTDIWEYTVEQIVRHPIFGNGYGTHWNLPEVVYNIEGLSWVSLAGSAHNGFLETTLSNGYPMIFFLFLFLVYLPLSSYFKAVKFNGHSPLLTLFIQVWLYVICATATESILFAAGAGWGMFIFSIMGLYYFSKFKSA